MYGLPLSECAPSAPCTVCAAVRRLQHCTRTLCSLDTDCPRCASVTGKRVAATIISVGVVGGGAVCSTVRLRHGQKVLVFASDILRNPRLIPQSLKPNQLCN